MVKDNLPSAHSQWSVDDGGIIVAVVLSDHHFYVGLRVVDCVVVGIDSYGKLLMSLIIVDVGARGNLHV